MQLYQLGCAVVLFTLDDIKVSIFDCWLMASPTALMTLSRNMMVKTGELLHPLDLKNKQGHGEQRVPVTGVKKLGHSQICVSTKGLIIHCANSVRRRPTPPKKKTIGHGVRSESSNSKLNLSLGLDWNKSFQTVLILSQAQDQILDFTTECCT